MIDVFMYDSIYSQQHTHKELGIIIAKCLILTQSKFYIFCFCVFLLFCFVVVIPVINRFRCCNKYLFRGVYMCSLFVT